MISGDVWSCFPELAKYYLKELVWSEIGFNLRVCCYNQQFKAPEQAFYVSSAIPSWARQTAAMF